MKKKVVSFLASGRGSNFTAVAEKILEGYIQADLGVLIADKENARALEIARGFGMDAFFVNPSLFSDKVSYEKEMISILRKYNTDLIVAAGFMRLLSPFFVNDFKNRIMNIHPALLPAFPGVNSQEQAFNYGVKITGCTVHFIDEGVDTGPIVLQSAIEIKPEDTVETLSSRILKEEHRILPESVRLYCEGKLYVDGRKVHIKV